MTNKPGASPTLSPKQEAFAQAVADGMTQADAYRSAYNTKAAPKTIQENASRLMADSKVGARVAELKGKLENKALWTREMSVKALVHAYKEGNATAKIAAVKELNLMHGYNAPSRHEITGQSGSPIAVATLDVSKLSTDALAEIMAAKDAFKPY